MAKSHLEPLTGYFVLYLGGLFIMLNFPSLRRLFNNSPITIVQNGKILYYGLKKARISIDVLLEELREEKVDDVKKVALANWEPDGKINFDVLKDLHKDEIWIVSKLKSLYHTDVKNVLLATLDNKDNLKIFLYK